MLLKGDMARVKKRFLFFLCLFLSLSSHHAVLARELFLLVELGFDLRSLRRTLRHTAARVTYSYYTMDHSIRMDGPEEPHTLTKNARTHTHSHMRKRKHSENTTHQRLSMLDLVR